MNQVKVITQSGPKFDWLQCRQSFPNGGGALKVYAASSCSHGVYNLSASITVMWGAFICQGGTKRLITWPVCCPSPTSFPMPSSLSAACQLMFPHWDRFLTRHVGEGALWQNNKNGNVVARIFNLSNLRSFLMREPWRLIMLFVDVGGLNSSLVT